MNSKRFLVGSIIKGMMRFLRRDKRQRRFADQPVWLRAEMLDKAAIKRRMRAKKRMPRENQHVTVWLKNGSRRRGFYFTNGTNPTFASYGADIPLDSIEYWEPMAGEKRKMRVDKRRAQA